MSGTVTALSRARPIGIVAGGGGAVRELIALLRERSESFVVAAIKGEADEALAGPEVTRFHWGEIGRMLAHFKANGCERLLLLGGIKQRPDFTAILGDPGTLIRLPKIVAAMRGGDDGVLQKAIGLIEAEGFKVVGIHETAPELLLGIGRHGSEKHYGKLQADIERGKAVLRDLGKHDIGQALAIHNGRVLAVEGAEGTDGMLRRVAALRREGRISGRTPSGVLLKGAKPGQDLRADLPAIGPDTVRLAAEAGLCGLVCEADRVLVADRARTFAFLAETALFLSGEGGFRDE